MPLPWKAGPLPVGRRYCQRWEVSLLWCLTPHSVGLEDGWLSRGSGFRSFGAILLTPFSFSLCLKKKKNVFVVYTGVCEPDE